MAVIQNLPSELLVSILSRLHGSKDLAACLLVCRGFWLTFQNNSRIIAMGMIRAHIPPMLIPYAVAVLFWTTPRYLPTWPYPAPTKQELRRRIQPQELIVDDVQYPNIHAARLASLVRDMSASALLQMVVVHEIVHDVVGYYSAQAMATLGRDVGDYASDLAAGPELSPTEYLRFCRTFYRALYYTRTPNYVEVTEVVRSAKDTLEPWEDEQFFCVGGFLTRMDVIVPPEYLTCRSMAEVAREFQHQALLKVVRYQRLAFDIFPDQRTTPSLSGAIRLQKRTLKAVFHRAQEIGGTSLTAQTLHGSDGRRFVERKPGSKNNSVLRRHAYVLWDLDRADALGLSDKVDFRLRRRAQS